MRFRFEQRSGSATPRVRDSTFRGSRHSTAGYTLVELLVAISILSIIAVAISGSFRTGLRFRERSRFHSVALEQRRALSARLRDDLNNLIAREPNLMVHESSINLIRSVSVDPALSPGPDTPRADQNPFASFVTYVLNEKARTLTRLELPIAKLQSLDVAYELLNIDADSLVAIHPAGTAWPELLGSRLNSSGGMRNLRLQAFDGIDVVEFEALERSSEGLSAGGGTRGDFSALGVQINPSAGHAVGHQKDASRRNVRPTDQPEFQSAEWVFWLPSRIR